MEDIFKLLILALISSSYCLTDEEIAAFKSRTFVNINTGIQGFVNIQPSKDGKTLLLTSNGLPDHLSGDFRRPNKISTQSFSYVINRNPKLASNPGCLPMGPIGLALNGVPIYNPFTMTCCDAGQSELNLFDECWGHPSPQGTYHYHTAPLCLMKDYCGSASSIVGVALDGYPIYGPFDEDGRELTPSDLDSCNGKFTNGSYRYHVTGKFPYFLKCFRGEVIEKGIRSNCKCKEAKYPCKEFEHQAAADDSNHDEMTVNEKLGLKRDGHFYCCQNASCSSITNTRSQIPTAKVKVPTSEESTTTRRPKPSTQTNLFRRVSMRLSVKAFKPKPPALKKPHYPPWVFAKYRLVPVS